MKKINIFSPYFGTISIIIVLFLFLPKIILAAETRSIEINAFSVKPLQKIINFFPFSDKTKGGGSVAVCDVNNDNENEIIVGAGINTAPSVKIFTTKGQAIFTLGFLAYNNDFRGGVNVACADLDGDNEAEIVTAPKSNASSYVRIFNRYGKPVLTDGFYANPKEITGGLNIAIADIDGSGLKEIITAPAYGAEPVVKIFSPDGRQLNLTFHPFHPDFKGGVSLAAGNVDGGRDDELIMAVQSQDVAWVKVIKADSEQIVLGNFRAYANNFKGGVNVATGDTNNDGYDEIITSANSGGGPHIKFFNYQGGDQGLNIFAYETDFTGGVKIATGDLNYDGFDELITIPNQKSADGRMDLNKYLEISISSQKLKYFNNGHLIAEFPVSTGKVTMPTPLGEFKIMNKATQAYSKKYGLYMPYWMQLTSAGHGIHGLPFWKFKNGTIKYEGEDHLGKRVSHGCVRLPVKAAAQIFEQMSVGTPVIINL